MTTWTFRALIASLALGFLSACDATTLGPPAVDAGEPQALGRVALAKGALTLVPPQGFCIDRSSIKPRFALMARCDALGAPASSSIGAPVALITVSLLEAAASAPLPTPAQTATAANLVKVSNPSDAKDMILYRAEGPVPVAGLDPRHWRGTARAGGFILGVALYGPPDSRAQSDEGRDIVRELIARTIAAN